MYALVDSSIFIIALFLRRIHKVIYYKDMNEIIEYPTVQAYLERKSEFRTIEENEENPFE